MKVIELLNKIANGGEVPKKIKYNDTTYTYHERIEKIYGFVDEEGIYLEERYYLTGVLNHEVEVLEEDKEIEELDIESIEANYVNNVYNRYDLIEIFGSSINKLRKELNELKKGK